MSVSKFGARLVGKICMETFLRRLWCTLWFGTSLQRQYYDILRIDSFDLLLVRIHFYH